MLDMLMENSGANEEIFNSFKNNEYAKANIRK
jgi:hypothetical protein